MVGTLISIILFIVGIICSYYIAKWQIRKNRIVHFSINSYDIGKGLSDEFPDFKLHFGDEILADNVMVLKGGFMNTGRNDIDGLKGEKDIKMILPEECKTKAITILSSTEGLTITATKDNEKDNIFNFGINKLFKTDEYFKYTAIVETTKEMENLHDKLKFLHRISNTEIKHTYIGLQKEVVRRRMYKWFKGIVAFLILLCLLLIPLSSFKRVDFEVINNTTNNKVKLYLDSESQIHVSDKFIIPYIYEGQTISSKDLKKEYNICPVTTYNWYNYHNIMLVVLFIITFLYLVFCYYILFRKYLGGDNRHIIDVIYPINN